MRAPATKELQVKLWAQGGIWDSAAFLLSAAVYPGWSAAAGADVPERHGAVLHGSTAAGSQRNPALVLEEQQIGQADPGLAPHHLPVMLEAPRSHTQSKRMKKNQPV